MVDLSDLGNDAGVSHNTIKEWLSVLEASYIIYRLPPHHKNFAKHLIRTPKLYFIDTVLLCWLLGIREDDQLTTHPLRGAIFENLVVSELLKTQFARGDTPAIYFWRDSLQLEVDLIVETARRLTPVEIKSAATLSSDQFTATRWMALADEDLGYLVYGGETAQQRDGVHAFPWRNIPEWMEELQ